MAEVRRIFVEKRNGFDIEAGHILSDLKDTLGIAKLEELRLFNRYDIEGLNAEDFERAAATILSEANVDFTYSELPKNEGWQSFAIEYLPGQYDQRADSAAQCIALLTFGQRPKVQTARVFAVKGSISEAELDEIKNYLINPVEARLASMSTYESLDIKTFEPENIKRVEGILKWNDAVLADFHAVSGFAMSVADLSFCRDYFRDKESREPTETELRVIDTYWSDHCRHTTFLTELEHVEIEQGKLSQAIEGAWLAYLAARKTVYVIIDKEEYPFPPVGTHIRIPVEEYNGSGARVNDMLRRLKFLADCEAGRDAEHMPPGLDSVFAVTDDKKLRKTLIRWAAKNGCAVVWGDDKDFEIALGTFPMCCVFDRTAIEDDTWKRYQDILSPNINIVDEVSGKLIYSCVESEDDYYCITIDDDKIAGHDASAFDDLRNLVGCGLNSGRRVIIHGIRNAV
ncbi:MAG: TcpQ domain-containing protein [Eubacteriales bacterium]